MPQPGRIKRIRNPDDDEQYVDLRLVEELEVVTVKPALASHIHPLQPRGQFQRIKYNFRNDEDADRTVRVKTITHKQDKDENGEPDPDDADDDSQRLEVEIIEELETTTGGGPDYQLSTTIFNPFDEEDDDAPTTRKFHRRKVYHVDDDDTVDPDTWIELKRSDEITVETVNKDGGYQKIFYHLKWKDDAFDKWKEKPPEEGDPGIDPPWRIDPLQQIVNVKWGGAVEFEPESRIFATLPSALDTGKILLALWVRVPSDVFNALAPNDSIPLIQFGPPAPTMDNTNLGVTFVPDAISELQRSYVAVTKNKFGRSAVDVQFVGKPFQQDLYACQIAEFSDTHIETLSGTGDHFHSQVNFGSTPEWARYDNFEASFDGGVSYPGIGWWDIDESGHLNGICNFDANVPDGPVVVTFRLHYWVGDKPPVLTGTAWQQLAVIYRAQTRSDATASVGHRGASDEIPIVLDAWNLILCSADVSIPVHVVAPAYHFEYDLTHTFKFTVIDSAPSIETCHKLYISINNTDYSATELYSYNSVDGYVIETHKGDALPVLYGGKDGFGVYDSGFLWTGQMFPQAEGFPRPPPDCTPGARPPQDTLVAPWQLAVSGFSFGVPIQPEPQRFLSFAPSGFPTPYGTWPIVPRPATVELAHVSVWFGIAADVSLPNVRGLFLAPDGKFIPPKSDGEEGRPLGAHRFYGEPSLYFTGGKTAFPKNKGLTPPTAPDSYTASASGINNYSPAPRKAGEVVGI
jgi:hypothetical protein